MSTHPKLPKKHIQQSAATRPPFRPSMGNGRKAASTMRPPMLGSLQEDDDGSQITTTHHLEGSRAGPLLNQTQIGLGHLTLSTKGMDPSNAPTRYDLTWQPKKTQLSTQLTAKKDSNGDPVAWVLEGYCVKSPFNRKTFIKGMMIALPFHVPNTNEYVKEGDQCLTETKQGPVYSKRRLAIVLWRHNTGMICLPLYSFQGVGISKQPEWNRHEYMEITNVGWAKSYSKEGPNGVLEADMGRPLQYKSCVHVAGSFRVEYQEDITLAGQLTEDSKRRLTMVFNDLNKRALAEIR